MVANVLRALLVMAALEWAGSAHAALMPPVAVDGREWLQPLDFVNHSWGDIASVCDNATGACNGSLGGNSLTGWTWAGIYDLYDLFTALDIPGFTDSYYEDVTIDFTGNSTWAPAFLDAFLPTSSGDGSEAVTGFLRNPVPVMAPVRGTVADNVFIPRVFLVSDFAQTTMSAMDVAETSEFIGGWFYRAEVPSPATIPLLGVGFAALFFSRRRPKIKA